MTCVNMLACVRRRGGGDLRGRFGHGSFLQCMSRRRLRTEAAISAAVAKEAEKTGNARSDTGGGKAVDGAGKNGLRPKEEGRTDSTNSSGSSNRTGVASGGGETTAVATKQGLLPACNKFLRALGDAGRIDDAVVAYEAMTASYLVPTIVTFSTLVSR